MKAKRQALIREIVESQSIQTQEELAEVSGVSLNTIRAYERKSKDLNKAQLDTVMRLAKTLKCGITELMN